MSAAGTFPGRSRGEVEAELAAAMMQFQRQQMGRGPDEARAYVLGDLILVRMKNVLTPAERHLTETPDGRRLIKQMRNELLESTRATLEEIVLRITGCAVVSLHTDISTKTGERVVVMTLDRNLEALLAA